MLTNLRQAVRDEILETVRETRPEVTHVEDGQTLTFDLGLSSLAVAGLVARLELQLGVEPFVERFAITDVRRVGDLCDAFETTARELEAAKQPA